MSKNQVELGVVIGRTASRIRRGDAFDHIGGYCIALDMTDRGLQDRLKSVGHPWFLAKSFDTACPIGKFIDKQKITNPHNVEIYCSGIFLKFLLFQRSRNIIQFS